MTHQPRQFRDDHIAEDAAAKRGAGAQAIKDRLAANAEFTLDSYTRAFDEGRKYERGVGRPALKSRSLAREHFHNLVFVLVVGLIVGAIAMNVFLTNVAHLP